MCINSCEPVTIRIYVVDYCIEGQPFFTPPVKLQIHVHSFSTQVEQFLDVLTEYCRVYVVQSLAIEETKTTVRNRNKVIYLPILTTYTYCSNKIYIFDKSGMHAQKNAKRI